MRICLISREYPPDTGWGGIGAYTFQHASALKKLGHDVEVIALAKEGEVKRTVLTDALTGVKVHRAPWGELLSELGTIWVTVPYSHYLLKSALALWTTFQKVHSEHPFDVAEAPEHLAEGLFPALTRVCPLVVRLHTPHSKIVSEGLNNLKSTNPHSGTAFDYHLIANLERMAMLNADVLSSPSRNLASYVASDCGLSLDKIEIVHNPVDTARFCPEGERAITGGGGALVFFAGRLEERKGVQHLIEAVPAVLSRCPEARFVVCGADTATAAGGTSMLALLKEQLAKNGSSHAVQFVSHVNHADMPGFYRSADVCVVPSLYDNAAYTVLEALSTGKPVVGSSAGGTPEYVLHDHSGLIVPPADSRQLAQALIELIEDKCKCARLGQQARSDALQKFDRLKVAALAVETYERAIERHRHNVEFAVYKKPPEELLGDIQDLLYSYHKGLYDLLSRYSLKFRIEQGVTLAMKRPRLFVGKALLSFLKPLANTAALKRSKLSYAVKRLEATVEAREAERDLRILRSLGVVDEVTSRPDSIRR